MEIQQFAKEINKMNMENIWENAIIEGLTRRYESPIYYTQF